jgi:hypothetical protein
MVMPHATGHVFASDGCLLRVDNIAGQWVASRYGPILLSNNGLSAPMTRCTDKSSSGGDGEERVDRLDARTGQA